MYAANNVSAYINSSTYLKFNFDTNMMLLILVGFYFISCLKEHTTGKLLLKKNFFKFSYNNKEYASERWRN